MCLHFLSANLYDFVWYSNIQIFIPWTRLYIALCLTLCTSVCHPVTTNLVIVTLLITTTRVREWPHGKAREGSAVNLHNMRKWEEGQWIVHLPATQMGSGSYAIQRTQRVNVKYLFYLDIHPGRLVRGLSEGYECTMALGLPVCFWTSNCQDG